MSAKNYLRILQGGIIASLLIIFFVFSDLLFPYITSKQLSFNVLLEFLFVVWLVFIMRWPQYRPKKSFITWGLLAYFAAILASCAVSVNFTLSFWGNAERMLGFFPLIHFLIFYFILITVFRSWQEWRALLFSSALIAILVSLNGLFGANVYSTIGNTAYVSGYLIFNIFFSVLLWLRSENKNWGWFYIPGIIIMLYEFWSCHTSGAIIGLFLSVLLLFLLLGLTHKNKTLRRASLVVLVLAVVGVAAIFLQYQSAWFQKSFLKNLTPEKSTFQTRLISWKSAADDFKYHPWLGTGFGNYAIIFDKHFDASFYNYAITDTYFDRAHNNLIDIASTTGLIGLLTYLSIFAAVIYYLVKKFRANGGYAGADDEGGRKNLEIIVLASLLTAYFIQNLAVFDSLVTYIGIMITLGFIYWLTEYAAEEQTAAGVAAESGETKKPALTLSAKSEWPVLIILILAVYIFTSYYNIRPWRMFQGTIRGYGDIVASNFSGGIAAYQSALVDTPLDHDARVTLINLVSSNPQIISSLPGPQATSTLDYVVSLAQKNAAIAPLDSLTQMQLAQVLDVAARFNSQDSVKFANYSSLALNAIDKAIAASPGRAPVYLVKAQMLLIDGQSAAAIKTALYGVNLNTNYADNYCRLAQFYAYLKDTSNFGLTMTSCVDLHGVGNVNSSTLLGNALSYFAAQGDYQRAISVAERLAALNSSDAQIWFDLAKLYYIEGETVKADGAAQQAIIIDKTLSGSWTNFKTSYSPPSAPYKSSGTAPSVQTATSTKR